MSAADAARRAAAALAAAVLVAGCATVAPPRADPCWPPPPGPAFERTLPGAAGAPERGSGFTPKALLRAERFAAVAANPHASRAACLVLARGGSAVDAAIAAQWVLGVVEPQSSGLGGGGFALVWDARRRDVSAWDGRETAPAAARPDDLRWVDDAERTPPRPDVRASGRSVGVPGLVHLLGELHRAHGRLPWADLLAPAVELAEGGFAASPRLAAAVAGAADALARDAHARAVWLRADGRPIEVGDRVVQPALARTLRALAAEGAAAFYRGDIARGVVDAVADTRGGSVTPGRMTAADLAAYRSVRREPVCAPYRRHLVCGMPPPSSGGIAVAQALGIVEAFDLAALAPADAERARPDPLAVHLVTEALRLAFADRNRYVADTDFVPLPGAGVATLLDRGYLRRRAALIGPLRSIGTAAPGEFGVPRAADAATPRGGTTHLSIVDADGNAVALTSSVEAAFGSLRLARGGFVLNNQLTDFAAEPAGADGVAVANRLEAGKRPRSSMAPTLVFATDAGGRAARLVMASGSPGGPAIIADVLKSVVGVLDWGLDAQQAASLVAFVSFNAPLTIVGGEHPGVDARDDGAADPLVAALRARGHDVRLRAHASGLAVVVRRCGALRCTLEAGADPRREGVALGR